MESNSADALHAELEFYRQNQTLVEQEIRTLITDNQKLSQQVGTLLKEKLQFAQQNHENDCTKELDELKRQISLITKERDSLHVLWQTSQKTIDALDTELKTYQSYDSRGKQNITEEKRSLELKLERALSDYVELETKYHKLQTERNNFEADLKNREKEILSYKERGKEIEAKLEEFRESLQEHKINLVTERKGNEDLKVQLTICQKECVDKVKREAEAKSKVAEALQLFDLASAQKKEAYQKISALSGELSRVNFILANIKRDTDSVHKAELDEVRERYNEKVTDMLGHIRNLDAELVEKGLLLNKAQREIKILQEAIENHVQQQKECRSARNPKLALAEQRLEAMFQELVLSERRNIQLVCEKQSLAIDIQRIQDTHSREIKRRDWEENLLKTQCEELKLQVEHLNKSLDETHGMVNNLQSMLSSRTELSQKMVSTKEEELLELNKHLENQMELNRKWKESYVDMTEKLKKKLEALDRENKELRAKLRLPYVRSSQDDSSNS